MMTREAALGLLLQYNKDPFHIRHGHLCLRRVLERAQPFFKNGAFAPGCAPNAPFLSGRGIPPSLAASRVPLLSFQRRRGSCGPPMSFLIARKWRFS